MSPPPEGLELLTADPLLLIVDCLLDVEWVRLSSSLLSWVGLLVFDLVIIDIVVSFVAGSSSCSAVDWIGFVVLFFRLFNRSKK